MNRIKLFFIFCMFSLAFIFCNYLSAQENVNLTQIATLSYPDLPCLSGVIRGNTAYFGNGVHLKIADISDPAQPVEWADLKVNNDPDDYIQNIAVNENFVYVASRSTLKAIDVSDPINPVETASCHTMGHIVRIILADQYAYLALEQDGFQIIDLSDPAHPAELVSAYHELAWYDTEDAVLDVAIKGDYAYLAQVQAGLRIVDISDPFKMHEKAFCDIPGLIRGIVLDGNYAYLANSRRGISIVNITDPANPVEAAVFDTEGFAWDVAVFGNQLLVADQNGLRSLDISDPLNCTETAFINLPNNTRRVDVTASFACVPNYASGLQVIDMSDPNHPEIAVTLATGDEIMHVDADNGILCMAKGNDGLVIIDVSNPYHPEEKSVFDQAGGVLGAKIVDHFICLVNGQGLRVLDVSDGANPRQIAELNSPGLANDIILHDNTAFIADAGAGVLIIDLSDPASPCEIGAYDTDGMAQGVAAAGDCLYVADGGNGICIIDVSNPAMPQAVGSFSTQEACVDITTDGENIYVASAGNGIYVIDVTQADQPTQIACLDEYTAASVEFDGHYLYVTDCFIGLRIYDVSDPSHPVVKADSYQPPGFCKSVAMDGRNIYLGASGFGIFVFLNGLMPMPELPYLTQRSGGLYLSIFGNGAVGYNLEPYCGSGCCFRDCENILYAGSFLFGNADRIHGMVYNQYGEFVNVDSIQGFFKDAHFHEITHTAFNDAGADQPFGVMVKQHTYAGKDDDFIYFHYAIENQSGNDLHGMYAGLFLDWDIGDARLNTGGIDISHHLVYQYESNENPQVPYYFGVIALSELSGARVASSKDYQEQDSLYAWLSTCVDPVIADIGDCRLYTGSGPYTISNGSTKDVWFCIIAAVTLNEMYSRSDYAIQRWHDIFTEVEERKHTKPTDFALLQNYPNPFNAATRITYSIPHADRVLLELYDISGRKVETLINTHQLPGAHTIQYQAAGCASGIYFYRLKVGEHFIRTKKMVVMR